MSAAIALAIVGIVGGLILLGRGLGGYRRATLISDVAGATISAIAVGENRVSGTIEPAEMTLVSPLQSETCVYYRASVVEEGERSQSRVFQDERAIGFRVRDASGTLRVFPRGATFDVPDQFNARSGIMGDDPVGLRIRSGPAIGSGEMDRAAQIADLLTVHPAVAPLDGLDGATPPAPAGWLFGASVVGGGRRHYREARLAVGDQVTLVGMVLPFDQLDDPDGSDAMDGNLDPGGSDPEVAADLAEARASGSLAASPEEAWGNAAIPGFGIGHPTRTPTLDPAAARPALATAAEAARAERIFDINPGTLVLASQPQQRLLVTAGTPALATQRADDRFVIGLLGAGLSIASAIALAWMISSGLGS